MHDFTILVLKGASAASVALTLEVLAGCAALARKVGAPTPRWRVLLADGSSELHLALGMSLKASPLPKTPRADGAIWVVPGIGMHTARDATRRLTEPDAVRAVAALRAQARAGATVAGSCSAVYLLQAAGLLAGRRATTSWWLSHGLQQLEPACQVDDTRMVVEDKGVVTAGAALAQIDLMLHLVRGRFGAAMTDAVSRVLLMEARQNQGPFITPSLLAPGDDLVSQLSERIEKALPHPPSVADMARDFHLSERTLARRVKAATGHGPLALVQNVRLQRARSLLETSRLSVEQVAARVGYGDATALRRLMKKNWGASPRQMRVR